MDRWIDRQKDKKGRFRKCDNIEMKHQLIPFSFVCVCSKKCPISNFGYTHPFTGHVSPPGGNIIKRFDIDEGAK